MEIKRVKEVCKNAEFCQDCLLYVTGDNVRFPDKDKVCLIDSTLTDSWDVDLIEGNKCNDLRKESTNANT